MTFQSLISAGLILMQISWSHSYPSGPVGVGSYSYQDSLGHRYEGTIRLKDGQVVYSSVPETVAPPPAKSVGLRPFHEEFIPTFLLNFENLLQELFPYNFQKQKYVMDAAQKALDLTSNGAGNIPNSDFSFPSLDEFASFTAPDYTMAGFADQSNFGIPNQFIGPNPAAFRPLRVGDFGAQNSAYAGAIATPDFVRQYAGVNPMNAKMRNIDETTSAVMAEPGQPQYKSVYSSSFAKSSFVNGKEQVERGAKTYVNDNGKITKFEVKT